MYPARVLHAVPDVLDGDDRVQDAHECGEIPAAVVTESLDAGKLQGDPGQPSVPALSLEQPVYGGPDDGWRRGLQRLRGLRLRQDQVQGQQPHVYDHPLRHDDADRGHSRIRSASITRS